MHRSPLHQGPASRSQRLYYGALALAAVLVFALTPSARAVNTQGKVSVTPSMTGTLETADYTISRFRTANRETLNGFTLTFPSGVDVSGATSPGAGDIVTITGNTVRVDFGTPIGQRTNFTLTIGNVVNPQTAGTYRFDEIVFHEAAGDQTLTLAANEGTFDIVASPFLSLSLTTSDGGTSLDFGDIVPEGTYPNKTVTVSVLSSAPYLLSRDLLGDALEMGLSAAGVPLGSQPAGSAVFTDTLSVAPDWASPPGNYAATVSYTVLFE